tara:strand:- start:263 stop:733 length:471 start_codon:yes stop_codon:yes gene_type:complete
MPIATNGSSIKVSNLKVLKNLACKIANKIKSGETILLYGQLGVGKTTFARFFINHLQKKTNSKITEVPSPTFTVMYEYLANQKLIQHYDFYRVKNYKELNNIGVFEDNEVISLIEWPEKIKFKPKNRIELKFKYLKNFKNRNIKIKLFGNCKKYEF